jgi:hypothetical protein
MINLNRSIICFVIRKRNVISLIAKLKIVD